MKIDDLVALIKAGYTKQEIDDLVKVVELVTIAEPDPISPEPEPVAPEQVNANNGKFDELEKKLDYVINRFNYMAVAGSRQPDQGPKETVDDILASVVRGNKKEDN